MPRRKGRLEIPPRGILTGPDLRQRHDAAAAARRMLRARMGLRNDALLRCRPFERAVCTTSCTTTEPSPSLPGHAYPHISRLFAFSGMQCLAEKCAAHDEEDDGTNVGADADGGREISFIGAPILLLLPRPSPRSLLRCFVPSSSVHPSPWQSGRPMPRIQPELHILTKT